MTHSDFDKFQDTLLKLVVKMKETKGIEYANGESRFGNFDRLSERLGISREAVCLVFLTKHMDSIESFVKNDLTVFSEEPIMGRLVDAITYLTLLAGMIDEDLAKRVQKSAALGSINQSKFSAGELQPLKTDLDDPINKR